MTQELAGQTVVVLGGSYGIGMATAWRARAAGASVVLTSRDPDRLAAAATVVGTEHTANFDIGDRDARTDVLPFTDPKIAHKRRESREPDGPTVLTPHA